MASREGINPLRPYYIPQTGLSPVQNATSEVSTTTSAQVFGSSARDLIPDLDYADYLNASPSISDWFRDAMNRALVRYIKVLTAQPFDVAKTILQVYVASDATEGQFDQRSIPGAGSDSYDSVWKFHPSTRGITDHIVYRNRNHPTMRAHISHPQYRQPQSRPRHALIRLDIASPIAVAIFVLNWHRQDPKVV